MNRIKIAIVGLGKSAREQHLPAITASPLFELVAIASPDRRLDGVPSYASLAVLLEEIPGVEAVAICTPPQVRYEIARMALVRGKHVLLEKPAGATLSEVASLVEIAASHRATLFAAWPSRAASGVGPARSWLAPRTIRIAHVHWREDVRVTHPGQRWIWEAGGFGVFNTGINALSILTHIMPSEIMLKDAELLYPANCETPIAANLLLDTQGASIRAEFEFRQSGALRWDIDIETDEGRLLLSRGGSTMHVNGNSIVVSGDREYPRLYMEFATLIGERRSNVDVSPLRLVADAFMSGRRVNVAPFVEWGSDDARFRQFQSA